MTACVRKILGISCRKAEISTDVMKSQCWVAAWQLAEARQAWWAGLLWCVIDSWHAKRWRNGSQVKKKDHTKGGSWDAVLSFGTPSWMTDKNLLWRKGWAWLKGLTAFILTGWLISHYSSRLGLSEGNSGKYLILSDIDYLERSFCMNPNTLSCLCLEMAQWVFSNFLVEVLQSLITIKTL